MGSDWVLKERRVAEDEVRDEAGALDSVATANGSTKLKIE